MRASDVVEYSTTTLQTTHTVRCVYIIVHSLNLNHTYFHPQRQLNVKKVVDVGYARNLAK